MGSETLQHLELVAGDLGATEVRLDTNSVLTTAITLYTRRGYLEIEAYNDNPYARRWFAKNLG